MKKGANKNKEVEPPLLTTTPFPARPFPLKERRWLTFAPYFCSMQITQEVRDYAVQKGLDEQMALEMGMKEKAEEFRREETGVRR